MRPRRYAPGGARFISQRGATAGKLAYADVEKVRTVFEWGPQPKHRNRKQDTGRTKEAEVRS